MRQTIQTVTIILMTGTMLAGCDYRPWTPEPREVAAANEKTEKENAKYVDLEDMLRNKHTVTKETGASDIAARLSEKYGKAVDELKELGKKNDVLLKNCAESREQVSKLKAKLTATEKELTDANEMLKEMEVELKQWKGDVLGFRDEMRQSQKALIEGVTRLHVLISGGVAMDAPTTQPAPIASNTKEKTGETLR